MTAPIGASRRRKAHRPRGLLAMVDDLLVSPVVVIRNGKRTKITALEAILHQLLQQEMAGSRHASHVLLQYRRLAREGIGRRLEISFVDSDYTRSLAAVETSDG